jgi:hypothetical protein
LGGIVDHTILIDSLIRKLLDCHIEPLPLAPRILSAILQSETQNQLQKSTLKALLKANLTALIDSSIIASTIFQQRSAFNQYIS